MKISKRLEAISNFVDQDSVVADIGCDHAQLCCYLIENEISNYAYACDVNEGPLQQAKKNIINCRLENKIETIKCDGLDGITEDVSCIVIAGMGFETIQKILDHNLDKLIPNRSMIIQSNRDVNMLRLWISNHHYHISNEKVVLEDNHYYHIIKFDTTFHDKLNPQQIMFGINQIKDFEYYSSIKNRMCKIEKILKGLDEFSKRYQDLFNELKMIYIELGSE